VVHPATFDSGGMAAAEAMAWGLPGVSFDLESLKTYYPQGVFKVPAGNIETFAQAILDLLDRPELYRKFSEQAVRLIMTSWDWEVKADSLWQAVRAAQNETAGSPSDTQFKTLETLEERRTYITRCYDAVARSREGWIRRRRYYYNYLAKVLRFLVEPGQSVLQVKCETGFYLDAVRPSRGVGLDSSEAMVEEARRLRPRHTFVAGDLERVSCDGSFDVILCVNALGDVVDIRRLLRNLRKMSHPRTRVIIINYNALWKPLIVIAGHLRLKIRQPIQNWLSPDDMRGLLYLNGYEVVKDNNILLCPVWIPVLSWFSIKYVLIMCWWRVLSVFRNRLLP
jgi:2-polyprenyl-3-methyl-5-hydroxy-6-metoxy-1,4-benzoquinol methylase